MRFIIQHWAICKATLTITMLQHFHKPKDSGLWRQTLSSWEGWVRARDYVRVLCWWTYTNLVQNPKLFHKCSDCTATFKALYYWTFINGSTHMHYIDAWISNDVYEARMNPAINESSAKKHLDRYIFHFVQEMPLQQLGWSSRGCPVNAHPKAMWLK